MTTTPMYTRMRSHTEIQWSEAQKTEQQIWDDIIAAENNNYSDIVIPTYLSSSTSTISSSVHLESAHHAIANSGITGHFITEDAPCINIHKTYNLIPITIPNGDIITSTYIKLLPQQNLPLQAKKAYIFPNPTNLTFQLVFSVTMTI